MMRERIAKEPFDGTGNAKISFNGAYNELVLYNDGTTDLTFTTGNFTFRLRPDDVFNEEINPFNYVQITASGAYRGYVREDVQ